MRTRKRTHTHQVHLKVANKKKIYYTSPFFTSTSKLEREESDKDLLFVIVIQKKAFESETAKMLQVPQVCFLFSWPFPALHIAFHAIYPVVLTIGENVIYKNIFCHLL